MQPEGTYQVNVYVDGLKWYVVLFFHIIAPGSFNVSVITFFRGDGTPLVRALIKVCWCIIDNEHMRLLMMLFLQPSHDICSYQELNISINITNRANINALVTEDGPIPHRGNGSFEYDIIILSGNLKREEEYFMTVIVDTGFESSTCSYSFSKHLIRSYHYNYDYCVHKQI